MGKEEGRGNDERGKSLKEEYRRGEMETKEKWEEG